MSQKLRPFLAGHCVCSNSRLLILKVAAGTLDASTKIYAVRVDAVHADAYRVLGGLGAETKPGDGKNLLLLLHSLVVIIIIFFN